jgi:hypothetical protein
MHIRQLQPLQPQHLLSSRSRLKKRKHILFQEHNSPRFRFKKCFPLFPELSTQWRPLLPKGGGLIQVDIGGHPPVPNSNWLILTVFSSTRFSVMGTFLCNCGFCTYWGCLESLHNIQVDIGGRPPIPTSLFWKFSCQYIFMYF